MNTPIATPEGVLIPVEFKSCFDRQRAAYFAAGARLLLNNPVRPFDIQITTTNGSVTDDQVCEALAVRVAELNRWRPGGGLHFPFLRVATVAGASRSRLVLASFEALFRAGGARDAA